MSSQQAVGGYLAPLGTSTATLAWEDEIMELKCQHVSASEAGDEIFQILFKEKREQENGPYLLISRAFLEEDEGEPSPVYIETQDEQLIGHYPTVDAELTRNHLTIRLPSPADDTIEVEFVTSDREFKRIKRMLGKAK
jgi:hypothetical protein